MTILPMLLGSFVAVWAMLSVLGGERERLIRELPPPPADEPDASPPAPPTPPAKAPVAGKPAR